MLIALTPADSLQRGKINANKRINFITELNIQRVFINSTIKYRTF